MGLPHRARSPGRMRQAGQFVALRIDRLPSEVALSDLDRRTVFQMPRLEIIAANRVRRRIWISSRESRRSRGKPW